MNDLEKTLFSDSPNEIKGEYTKDEKKAEAYSKGIEKLEELLSMGCMMAYRADDVNKPQYLHQIEVRWLETENRIDGVDISEVLKCFDTLFFSREKIMSDTWILSSEIYKD